MLTPPTSYPYLMPWRTIIIGILLFGASTFILPMIAADPKHAPAILIVTLGETGTAWACKVLAVFGALFVAICLCAAFIRTFSKPELKLGADAVVVPHGLFSRTRTIPYASIERVWEVTSVNQVFLMIQAAGRKSSISASLLPQKADYEAVRDHLQTMAHGCSGQL